MIMCPVSALLWTATMIYIYSQSVLYSLLSGDLGWYTRVENNGWLPLAVRFASEGLVDKASKWEEERSANARSKCANQINKHLQSLFFL